MSARLLALAAACLAVVSGCAPAPGGGAGAPALIIDGSLVDPAAHRTLQARLRAIGLAPVYRRFDPRLGEADVERYRVVVWIAGGARGTAGSLAVEAAEVDRAERFVLGGGRLALGLPPGRAAAAAEGRAFQRLLERLGVPIGIAPHEVTDPDPAFSYAAPLFRAPLFEPAPAFGAAHRLPARIVAERAAPLSVGAPGRVLLTSGPRAVLDRLYGPPPDDPAAFGRHAVVADAGVGTRGGRVLVAPSALLMAGGTLPRATTEPLVPEALPAGAVDGRARFLAAALGDLVEGLPGLVPRPARADAQDALRARAAVCAPRRGEAWLDREGIRAAWGYVDRPEDEVATLLARLPATGLNALWGPAVRWWGALAHPGADPGRTAEAERGVARVSAAVDGTPVRWLAGVNVPGSDADLTPYPRAVSIGGRTVDVPSPVGAAFWESVVLPRVAAAAALAVERPALAGLVLDLEMYGRPVLAYVDAFDFGDGPFGAFLDDAGVRDPRARALPAAARGDWLLATGRLPAYYAWLESLAAGFGRRLRTTVDGAAPGRDLVLGFYAVGVLPHWFYRGLFRGASTGGRPVLLFTFQTDARADVAAAAGEGTCLYHAQAVLLGLAGEEGLGPALARTARRHDGFWLNRITHVVADYPVPPHDAVEIPPVRGEAAWAWLRRGVEAYRAARPSR